MHRISRLRGRAMTLLLSLAIGVSCEARPAVNDAGELRLPRLFADGMVLQRDTQVPVWGWAPPGAEVTVRLDGRSERTRAGEDGAWRVTFAPLAAGGPHELLVTSGDARVQVTGILAGDVWLASGQSNMEFAVANADGGAAAIASARDSSIREFAVPHSWAEGPQADVTGGGWMPADSAHVGGFSAVGYFFARALRESPSVGASVPIGVIHTSWGGSNIETWLSAAALGLSDSATAAIAAAERAYRAAIRDSLQARIGSLPEVDEGLVAGQALWAAPDFDDGAWGSLAVPGAWERAGYAGLDGVAWYRTSFDLTAAEAQRGAVLVLGSIDDNDITWVNGVEVGRTSRYDTPRRYDVPASALRAGRNVLAVRVEDGGGEGGIIGRPGRVELQVGNGRKPLAGEWKFRVAAVLMGEDGQHINKIPTWLYHQMLAPLLDFPIRGVIWYQGESNANNDAQAVAYRELFAELIRSWRQEWRAGEPDFPFLWVQLPNFGAVDTVPPVRAAWATLRESQAAALALPSTGQAVAIDIGDPADIHPRNKQEVGRRLALVARAVAYGEPVLAAGPTFRGHEVRDGRVVVEFDHVGVGLVSMGGAAEVHGFAVAGEDGRFVWANARIEGERVVVWSERVPHPVAVRYAWGNSPDRPGLYNQAELPAAPFRTDEW